MPALSLLLFVSALVWGGGASSVQCEFDSGIDWHQGRFLLLSPREKLVQTIYEKVDVVVDYTDASVSMFIATTGTFEPYNLRTMARFVKPGATILNVGSHIGLEAVVLGRIAGDEGRLFLFEPFGISYNMALKNIHLNRLAHISRLYNVAAGNRKTTGTLSLNQVNTGASGVYTDESIK
jgi:hypothetical protein